MSIPRIEVDPNSVSRSAPTLSVAMLSDADAPVLVGQNVWAYQPDDEGETGAPARIVDIDRTHGLVHLSVDWAAWR